MFTELTFNIRNGNSHIELHGETYIFLTSLPTFFNRTLFLRFGHENGHLGPPWGGSSNSVSGRGQSHKSPSQREAIKRRAACLLRATKQVALIPAIGLILEPSEPMGGGGGLSYDTQRA